MSKAEREAKRLFEVAVLAKGPCAMRRPRETCEGPMDSHHVIPAQLLKSHASTLSAQERIEILYDPRVGIPICRKHHGYLSVAARRLWRGALPDETVQFALDHSLGWALEREVPGWLESESPQAAMFGISRTTND